MTFTVDSDRPLAVSTRAQIRYRNLVGQRYVALVRGRRLGPRRCAGHGTIPLRQTQPALDLTVLFNGFKPLFAALNPQDVNAFAFEIIKTLQGEGGNVNSLLGHTASLTIDAGRPRRGHRPDHRQPQRGARHRRRARQAAVAR